MFRESERGALVDLVRLYLPEREAECTALTLKPCTSADTTMLQNICDSLVIVPRLEVNWSGIFAHCEICTEMDCSA